MISVKTALNRENNPLFLGLVLVDAVPDTRASLREPTRVDARYETFAYAALQRRWGRDKALVGGTLNGNPKTEGFVSIIAQHNPYSESKKNVAYHQTLAILTKPKSFGCTPSTRSPVVT